MTTRRSHKIIEGLCTLIVSEVSLNPPSITRKLKLELIGSKYSREQCLPQKDEHSNQQTQTQKTKKQTNENPLPYIKTLGKDCTCICFKSKKLHHFLNRFPALTHFFNQTNSLWSQVTVVSHIGRGLHKFLKLTINLIVFMKVVLPVSGSNFCPFPSHLSFSYSQPPKGRKEREGLFDYSIPLRCGQGTPQTKMFLELRTKEEEVTEPNG